MANPDTFGGMIASAIFGDDQEKAKQMRRMTCKLAASHGIFCRCGDVLDQRTVHVLEWRSGKTDGSSFAMCPACAQEHGETVKNIARDIRSRRGLERTAFFWTTWNAELPILPEPRVVAE